MKKAFAVTTVVVFGLTAFVAGTAVSGEGQDEKKAGMPEIQPPPPQLKALGAFAGDWQSAYEHLPAMFGEPGRGTGKFHCEWALDDWFLMGEGTSTSSFGPHKFVWMVTYDSKMPAYRSCSFDNHGMCTIATMTYQPETKTWIETSDGINFVSGKPAKNRTTMRFVSKDKLEWEWHQKVEGETEFTLMMKGTDTRVRTTP